MSVSLRYMAIICLNFFPSMANSIESTTMSVDFLTDLTDDVRVEKFDVSASSNNDLES